VEALREFMTERGLTQADLAKMFKVSQATVSDYLAGRITPRKKRLLMISEKTGLSVDTLLKGPAH